jgi:single-stranded-DNA-specific exonuclease
VLDRNQYPLYSAYMLDTAIQKTWRILEPTPRAAAALSAKLDLPTWAAQVLCHRGYGDGTEAKAFLDPGLSDLPPFHGLLGLDQALEILVPALMEGKAVGVAGDYDADGITSTALLVDFLRQCGATVVWDLPHRMNDGYGFSAASAQRLAQEGARLIVTVDCGISDNQGVDEAVGMGLPVIITDHHQLPPGPLPKAQAVINPQQPECGHSCHLAGVGVAFYLAAGLRAALKDAGYFNEARRMPNLRNSLDLVALGTMADVVPLKDCNRILVKEGIRVINQWRRPGLRALALAANQRSPLDSRSLAFGLAPRINAAGRMDRPDTALNLLLAEDQDQAAPLASRLEELNKLRRKVEGQVYDQAMAELDSRDELQDSALLLLAGREWHRGVLGIVASRVLSQVQKPVMLFSIENGTAYGSGRSLPGFHLQKALASCADQMIAFGGHAMAAGATVPSGELEALASALDQAARDQAGGMPQVPPLTLEAESKLPDLRRSAEWALERLSPFGQDNPEPLLAITRARVIEAKIVGQGHLKLLVDQEGARMSAIGFNLGHLMPKSGDLVDLAASPRISNFNGRRVELSLEDLRVIQP